MKNYTFDRNISREVLENYLSRSVTAAGLFESETLEDDLRVIRKLGVKFLGRASGIWYMPQKDEEHFAMTKALAEKVHQVDPEIILQACVFEWVTENMETVQIPEHVFADFQIPVEKRNFRLQDVLFQGEPQDFIHKRENPAKNGGIPDLNRLETQLWFYYRATQYINCGFEALHMGQIHLYTANDIGFVHTQEVFTRIRQYAEKNARRHKVLLDAHTHGVNIHGKLLFDYHAMPFTRAPLLEREGTKLVLVREGYSEGGVNPNGFTADTMPYLMEYDNWGGLLVENPEECPREELAYQDWWGWDQIAWFAHQNEAERNRFIEYTYKWIAVNNPNGYFEVPFRRMLGDGYVTARVDGKEKKQTVYQVNNPGVGCPMGFGQESAVEKIWNSGNSLREQAANPEMLIDYGARQVVDPETGVKLPEKIVVYGSFQPSVGAVKNDSNSEITRMYYVGNQTYSLTVILPYAGSYDFAVSTYGTLSATYTDKDRFPRSGSSNKSIFTTEQDNMAVKFTYCFHTNQVTVQLFS
ncbi:MAG: hypothetical protein RSC76_05200 [Oscillospiraceae bacterium]